MPQLSRRTLLALLGGLSSAGCVTGPRPGTTTDGPPSDRTPTPNASPPDGTPNGNGITHGVNTFDPDHSVYLSNEGSVERTVRTRVVREATGESVLDETRTIAPHTEHEIYNLKRADPDGIEEFSVCAMLADATPTPDGTTGTPDATPGPTTAHWGDGDCITMRTDACYGSAHVSVPEDGELQVFYAIC